MNIQPSLFPNHLAAPYLSELRTSAPLVHCMTNEVVQTFTANVLLALGASPAMVVSPKETAQFAKVADALLINIGTLHDSQAEAMLVAVKAANQAGTPWILDPVAVGGLEYRTHFAQQLIELNPAAIRGNASEILALDGQSSQGRGVDSADDTGVALNAAYRLATRYRTIVAVTGETDYITDGESTWSIPFGDKLMTRVVGTGCALSAVVAAFYL